MQPNLIDPSPIDRYLDALLPGHPEGQRLLRLALTRPLARRPENLEPLVALPADAPDWLRKKWPEGGPYHRFRPDADLNNKARHVADWLLAAVQDGEPWLKQLSHGRPTRLTAVTTLEDAHAMADADMRVRNKRLADQLAPTGEGEEEVADLGDDFRVVRLRTPAALDRESVAMGHCIGQGGYDESLQAGSREFFSLRDARNQPHATVEVDPARNAVLQCQGKENKPPVARYLRYLQRFLTERRYKLEAPASRTGLVEHDGRYHDIAALPAGLEVRGDLDLSGTPIAALPTGLKVGGHLDLSGTPIAALPAGLKVSGSLDLSGTPIAALPEGLKVGGSLDLSGTPIAALPTGLKVGGHLYLRGTPIVDLPEDAQVARDVVGHQGMAARYALRRADPTRRR